MFIRSLTFLFISLGYIGEIFSNQSPLFHCLDPFEKSSILFTIIESPTLNTEYSSEIRFTGYYRNLRRMDKVSKFDLFLYAHHIDAVNKDVVMRFYSTQRIGLNRGFLWMR